MTFPPKGRGQWKPDAVAAAFAGTARSFDLSARPLLPLSARAPPSSCQMSFWVASLLFWTAAVVCALAQAMLVRSLLLGRTPGSVKTRAAGLREVVWVLLPAVVLALTLVASWRKIHRAEPAAGMAPVAMGSAPIR